MEPLFEPPLHRQRHQFVIDFVKTNKPRKVLDLGCGECSLLKKLKFHKEVQLLAGVDINGAILKRNMHGLAPLSTDYLQPTFDQLCVKLYQGSVTQKDARLRGFDLVTSIELIEHLSLTDVELFSQVLFGYMTPGSIIVSTPNSEFNPLLPGLRGFRHSDHKFEWSRAEFQSWALKVSLQFGYEVEFTGVGEMASSRQERVGFCSQIAVFRRRDGCCGLFCDDTEDVCSYTLLYSVNYPSLHNNNILRRVLLNEVLFWMDRLKKRWRDERVLERVDRFELCQSEGRRLQREEEDQTVFGAQMNSLVEQRSRDVSVNPGGESDEESCMLQRYVSVPLAVVWTSCPKVGALSGSLRNLRHLLMDNPEVQLSEDGSALLVHFQEQDTEEEEEEKEEEEEDGAGLEDSGFREARLCSHNAEQEEDWDTNV